MSEEEDDGDVWWSGCSDSVKKEVRYQRKLMRTLGEGGEIMTTLPCMIAGGNVVMGMMMVVVMIVWL